ncbi:phosphomannomutase [Mesorhizobium australicum]|uniref:Phosphomannomutase n=1 Tax=Mesorhizobium australicum TaxID=536018 RepID=A0ACC6T846_9HYPH
MKFGTSGLRGLATELAGAASALYATAFATFLLESGLARIGDEILIGRDFRASSPAIAAVCAAALSALGFIVVDCGAVPTPALALYAQARKSGCLMITGSHIPADRNGIKFYRPDGEIDKGDEREITRIALQLEKRGYVLEGAVARRQHREAECKAFFMARNRKLMEINALKGLTVGVYQHSTVARDLLVDILSYHCATVVTLGRSEGFIPVDTEAVSDETAQQFKLWAKEHRLDAVVSADGDGDRPLVADDHGDPLRGDLLGLITANFLQAKAVVTPVTSNSGIETAGSFKVVRTKVGSPFVIAAMLDLVASGHERVVGFEANGGLLTGTDFDPNGTKLPALPTRDSFLPILAALSLVNTSGQPLSEIGSSFQLPAAAADRLENFSVESSTRLMTYLRTAETNIAAFVGSIGVVSKVSDVDGLRITLADKRVLHLRPSGNAPEMRCYVEAENREDAELLLRTGLDRIRNWAQG